VEGGGIGRVEKDFAMPRHRNEMRERRRQGKGVRGSRGGLIVKSQNSKKRRTTPVFKGRTCFQIQNGGEQRQPGSGTVWGLGSKVKKNKKEMKRIPFEGWVKGGRE